MMSDWRSMDVERWVIVATVAGAVVVGGLGGCASRSSARAGAPGGGGGGVTSGENAAGVGAVVALPHERTLAEIGAGILVGMEVAASREEWQIGDRVLIGVRATKPSGVTTRLVLVELMDRLDPRGTSYASAGGGKKGERAYEFKSDVAQTKITLFDGTGAIVGDAMGRFPVKLLGCGPYDGAGPMIGQTDALTNEDFFAGLPDEEFDRVMRGWAALFTFSGSLGKKGLFKQMMDDVIVKPSLIRMIFNPSASLTFGANRWPTREANWEPGSGSGLGTIHVPLELVISGLPALRGELLAAEPNAPLSLCGGLIRASGERPDDAKVRVDLELLGASRGNGGQVFKQAVKGNGGE